MKLFLIVLLFTLALPAQAQIETPGAITSVDAFHTRSIVSTISVDALVLRAATLLEQYSLISNTSLRNRVAAALAKAAEDVRNEALATPNHTERFAWASAILLTQNGPETEARRAMWLVVQNPTVADGYTAQPDGSTVTDNDIQFVVNGLVNILSGADTSV